jgi:hypothetical protein
VTRAEVVADLGERRQHGVDRHRDQRHHQRHQRDELAQAQFWDLLRAQRPTPLG